jgi:GT2 family glycosyltransferase
MRLTALIVTHNRLQTLRGALPRVLAAGPDRVLVIDNASDDGTAAWLAAQDDPRLSVLRLAENLGGAGGFAAGLSALMRGPEAPDWCVLFDDDAWPEPEAFDLFRARLAGADPDRPGPDSPGAVAAAVWLPSGKISEMNRPGLNPFWRLATLAQSLARGRGGYHVGDAALAPDAAPTAVDTASFVGFFVSRGAVARIGLPDPGCFLYGDDLLYSLGLRRAGMQIRLDPRLRFTHDCASLGDGKVLRPTWKVYYLARNQVGVARAAAGLLFPLALAWYVMQTWRRSRFCPEAERRLYRRLMWTGFHHGLMRRQGRNPEAHRIAGLATGGSNR